MVAQRVEDRCAVLDGCAQYMYQRQRKFSIIVEHARKIGSSTCKWYIRIRCEFSRMVHWRQLSSTIGVCLLILCAP
jgi:hypothetical protein